ncbi:MAG: VWA domain-containing protein [Holophagales bacterium]|nr:VWA domain-containing protein [Holophagales bacterium]MBK9966585.1 VWA domain-containing protein [Holophagales bacterium]
MRGQALAIATFLLAARLAAAGEEPRRLDGGFGRPVPTRTPSPGPIASPTAVRTPPPPLVPAPRATAGPSPRATAPPAVRATTLPAPPARPAAPLATRPAAPTATRPAAPRPAATPPRKSADVSVGYVLVPFVVTDRKGRPVGDLREQDVTLLSEGVPVAWDLFQKSADAPVSYAVLLDGSGSMGLAGKMEGAIAALETLAATRIPGDDFALFVFAEGELKEIVGFTEDAEKIVEAARRVKPWGKTAFRDALVRMPEESLHGRNGSKAIILLSDGIDNDSRITEPELTKLMEGVEIPVYPLGLRSPGGLMRPLPGTTVEWLLNVDVLSHIARITGGRMSLVDDPAQLPSHVLSIQKDLRHQYLIGFSPAGSGPVRYRSLTLRVAGPARPVRARAGYLGSDPPSHGPGGPGTR